MEPDARKQSLGSLQLTVYENGIFAVIGIGVTQIVKVSPGGLVDSCQNPGIHHIEFVKPVFLR